MVIFRENCEDIYAGIEFEPGSPDAQKLLDFLAKEFPKPFDKIRFGTQAKNDAWTKQLESIGSPARSLPVQVGIGIKPVSKLPRHRAPRAQRHRATRSQQAQVGDARAQGQHHEVHGRRLPQLGLCRRGARVLRQAVHLGQWERTKVAAARKPPMRSRPRVAGGSSSRTPSPTSLPAAGADCARTSSTSIATLNLNGDYLSDALAAQVGGIGIAPGANINYVTGHAVFEATHGTAPKYANQDKVNPGSVILSGEMMLRYMGWTEAADAIIKAMDAAIGSKTRHLRLRPPDGGEGATEVKCKRPVFFLLRSSRTTAAMPDQETIAVLLVLLWALGYFTATTMGGFKPC
jgi:isocitrate dehydrogenase